MLESAASLPFTIAGATVRGKRLGTELGFPTANLDYPPGSVLPPNGVYVAQATVEGRRYAAILNQGRHPTAPEGRATIETHLLDYAGGDLYGRHLTLCYLHYLRPERRFASLEALKAQLCADEADALLWLGVHAPELADLASLNAAETARRKRCDDACPPAGPTAEG
ncbi:MAG: hypothetical protein GX418_05780 [Clostridiales bacterium]|nr:hypothetical protein [Clostridiales bacterium]